MKVTIVVKLRRRSRCTWCKELKPRYAYESTWYERHIREACSTAFPCSCGDVCQDCVTYANLTDAAARRFYFYVSEKESRLALGLRRLLGR